MKQATSRIRCFGRRGVFVIGALLCLCASDSAGLRLLPLPAFSDVTLSTFPLDSRGSRASRSPSSNREPNAYLEMVAGSHYRVRDYQSTGQTATHSPELFCKLQPTPVAITPETSAILGFKSPHLSIQRGRAPPRLA